MELEHLQPQLFKEFNQILKSDRMNHAYLFSGDFASFDFALYLAKSRFCKNLQDGLPCGECRECQLIAENEFSDVKIVKPSGQVIKTDMIRELMRNFSRSGFEGKSQVFIIQDCEKMHVNAANSLLKVIEEPQSEIYIFFLTNDQEQILPTIRSRTQIFQFKKQVANLMVELEKAGLVKNKARLLAEFSQSQAEAEKLINQPSFWTLVEESERLFAWLETGKKEAYLQVAKLASLADDKEKQDQVFRILEVIAGQEILKNSARRILQNLVEARRMWKANVSFQNALEYLVLQ